MKSQDSKPESQTTPANAPTGKTLRAGWRSIELREWWLWIFAMFVTLVLTMGLVSFVLPILKGSSDFRFSDLPYATRGLVGLVLLFDIYTIYQQIQIHRMRRRLSAGEELFRLITENAADMIAVVDAHGQRLYNSPSYQKVLGYSQEELQSTSSLDQVHPADQETVKSAAGEAMSGSVGKHIEYRMRHKDGTWRTLESTASTIRNADGTVAKLVIVNRDITGRRRLEDQLRQSQKMEAVGRLSGGVAHDFNNLLGIIIGYGEILEEGLEPTNQLRESVEEILKAGRQAASLTRQLLAFSRQQVLEPKVIDLNSIISDTEKMLRRLIGEDVTLRTELNPSLARIKADRGQVEQVILNLAVNARDAMPHGGKLLIKTDNSVIDEVFAQQVSYPVQVGSYITLIVTDTGTGMDAATQSRIFEPFFTTKEKGKGTGLGLSLVYGVVKQSGGYINVHSEPGRGTTFTIHFPAVDAAIDPHDRPKEVRSLKGTETILVVEDQDGLLSLTRSLLERGGYRVLVARDGDEALKVSQQFKEKIHLMLTDVILPGINGRVLADLMAQHRPDMKVVYMSGYTGQTFNGHAILAPGSIFLMKPFTREALAAKIGEGLESAPVGELSKAAAHGQTS
jgi:two-component system, cell cycle sensor histidine kinase and response regulator CckA